MCYKGYIGGGGGGGCVTRVMQGLDTRIQGLVVRKDDAYVDIALSLSLARLLAKIMTIAIVFIIIIVVVVVVVVVVVGRVSRIRFRRVFFYGSG